MKPEKTIFQVVRIVGRKRVLVDGRRMRREKTFKENIDLFNVNERGIPKSYDEVMASVIAKAMEWERDVN